MFPFIFLQHILIGPVFIYLFFPPHSNFKKEFFEVQLIYSVMLVYGVEPSDSVICFLTFFLLEFIVRYGILVFSTVQQDFSCLCQPCQAAQFSSKHTPNLHLGFPRHQSRRMVTDRTLFLFSLPCCVLPVLCRQKSDHSLCHFQVAIQFTPLLKGEEKL